MHREVLDPIVAGEGDVHPQVADLVGPSALGQTPLSERTALASELLPAATMDQSWKRRLELQVILKIKFFIK